MRDKDISKKTRRSITEPRDFFMESAIMDICNVERVENALPAVKVGIIGGEKGEVGKGRKNLEK